jgi:hypothetical protein
MGFSLCKNIGKGFTGKTMCYMEKKCKESLAGRWKTTILDWLQGAG